MKPFRWRCIVSLLPLAGLVFAAPPACAAKTSLISGQAGVRQTDDESWVSKRTFSADGRFLVFESYASNLVEGDTNGKPDVFLLDRLRGGVTRVSVSSAGAQGDGNSWEASISPEGRFVVFASEATNLVDDDSNGSSDVFLHDRQTGVTERVSVGFGGTESNGPSFYPCVSADGRAVAFESYASNLIDGDVNAVKDVFLRDRQTGVTEQLSRNSAGEQADGSSESVSMSADLRYVAFRSLASNLVPEDTDPFFDVFVRDRQLGTTTRVSVSTTGADAGTDCYDPIISADGRWVVFDSLGAGLVPGDTNGKRDVFRHDRQTGTTERLSVTPGGGEADGHSSWARISDDGRYVAFASGATNLDADDSNGFDDIFLRDCQTATTVRVSLPQAGGETNQDSYAPTLSADGRLVAFESRASNLTPEGVGTWGDVFLRDVPAATTTRVSVCPAPAPGNGLSRLPAISGDGRFVVFSSGATNLLSPDANGTYHDVLLRDAQTESLQLVSQSSDGVQADFHSTYCGISTDGRYVAFLSTANDLVPGIVDAGRQVYLRDRQAGTTELISASTTGGKSESSVAEVAPRVSQDGRFVAFVSSAADLVASDTNGVFDIFVRDRQSGTTERVSVSSEGAQANAWSLDFDMSPDGRYVVFDSPASDLVPDDTNSGPDDQGVDIFLRDRQAGSTERVNLTGSGEQLTHFAQGSVHPSVSAEGRYVAFETDATNLMPWELAYQCDIYVRDRQAATTTRASVAADGGPPNGQWCSFPTLSGDGRYVAFVSQSTNLLPAATNGSVQLFLRDLQAHSTELVSVSSSGREADSGVQAAPASMDAEGRYIAFTSEANNLVAGVTAGARHVFLRDRGPLTAPTADFSAAPTAGAAPLSVAFTDLSTGDPTAWSWAFGDGEHSVLRDPVHTYTAAGSYSVTLEIASAGGTDMETKSNWISVGGAAPPVADFAADETSGAAPLAVQFTDASTNGPTSWSWTFGDGGGSELQNPAHTYTEAGSYSVGLTATNAIGSDSEAKSNYIAVTPGGAAPVAAFIADRTSGTVPLAVQFADISTNSPTAWSWTFGDSGTSTVQNPSHAYTEAGQYTVVLTASNAAGSDSESKASYITANPVGGAPMAAFSADVTEGTAPLAVLFTDASTNTPTAWSWSFGDGTTATAQSPAYTYQSAGRFTVTLTVTNAAGSDSEVRTHYLTVTFTDVALTYWSVDQVLACVDAGIVAGYSDGTYRPTAPVTRDQMAVYISRALAGSDAKVPAGPTTASFTDVTTDHWAFRHIEYAKLRKIVTGYSDNTYRPAVEVTRDQMAVYISRSVVDPTGDEGLAGYVPPTNASFADVPITHWAFRYIEYAKSRNIVKGYSDGYRPTVVVTRDQMAVYVARAFGLD